LPLGSKYGALAFMFLNAFCPIIFTYWWSITMVVKEQGDDEKVKLMIMDISSKSFNERR